MIKNYTLNSGVEIPEIGFGTYKIPFDKLDQSINIAYDCGYRLFDTAKAYNNEELLGNIFSHFPRESLFLTGKLWITDMGKENVERVFLKSLKDLKTDYLDLYLIHWPVNESMNPDYERINIETWEAMIGLLEKGAVRAIGVSNFTPKYLDQIEKTGVLPAVDQVEYHPGYLQENTYDYARSHDIRLEAWQPLARQKLADIDVLVQLANKYGVSVSQIILRFIIQTGVIPIPKGSSRDHIEENIDVFGFELSAEEISQIRALPQCAYSGLHPDTFTKY